MSCPQFTLPAHREVGIGRNATPDQELHFSSLAVITYFYHFSKQHPQSSYKPQTFTAVESTFLLNTSPITPGRGCVSGKTPLLTGKGTSEVQGQSYCQNAFPRQHVHEPRGSPAVGSSHARIRNLHPMGRKDRTRSREARHLTLGATLSTLRQHKHPHTHRVYLTSSSSSLRVLVAAVG